MPTILITSMGGSGSLNLVDTIRLNDPEGTCRIIGTHFDPFELAKSDLKDLYVVPRAKETLAFSQAHASIIEQEKVDILIANSDKEVASFSEHLDLLHCKHLIPNQQLVEAVQDKYTLHTILSKHGNPAVKNIPVPSREELRQAVAEVLTLCDKFWIRLRDGAGSQGATWMYTSEQAEKWVDLWCELRGMNVADFVLAPFLPGRDFCVALLFQEGRFSVGKIYERLGYAAAATSISQMGSTPSASRTIAEQQPVDTCIAAVRAVCEEYGTTPHGFYQLDMKCDDEGTAYVTEINIGRFPMTSPQFDRVGKHSMLNLYIDMLLDDSTLLPENEYDFAPGTFILRAMDLPCTFVKAERVEEIKKRTV
ncbi:MAG: hypothetical protein KKB70_11425 [Proteobacteria bacterium]|nr:hypothetical protein [Pseudomonadota bacterium]MBU1611432.1 hypothetical protein [Pseudomonadota bacterium]